MSELTALPEDDQRADRFRYSHLTTESEQRRLERRTAATSASFFLPYLRPGMRLLDCGCGPGSITLGLAEAVAPGETIGVDLQPAQLERARQLAAEHMQARLRFEVASVYQLPFSDAAFDAAFAHTLMLHLTDPLRALREIRRVLKPGGLVGIADNDDGTHLWEPQTPLLAEVHQLFKRVIRHNGGDPLRARHHRQLLREAGFLRPVAGASLGTVGVYGTLSETRAFAAWYAEEVRARPFVEVVTSEGWADASALETMAAEVLAWGEHPDAFLAQMGVTAVGWVEE